MRRGLPLEAVAGLCLLLMCSTVGCGGKRTWPVRGERSVEAALAAAGENRAELEHARASLAPEERAGFEFLLPHMPDPDLRTLSSAFLVEDITLAFATRRETPWGRETPRAMFDRQVLPYACASEPREPWRRLLREALMPKIADCDTVLEAAQRINETVWEHFGIEYAGGGERVDQSPRQTIARQAATCTGYAIFFTAAARAVGIPSRVMAIAGWPHKPGNHTWVEIWDTEGWHVIAVGSPEHYIDATWVMDDALNALRDEPRHAVYAASFTCTDEWLAAGWARHRVFGLNETDRYLAFGPVHGGR